MIINHFRPSWDDPMLVLLGCPVKGLLGSMVRIHALQLISPNLEMGKTLGWKNSLVLIFDANFQRDNQLWRTEKQTPFFSAGGCTWKGFLRWGFAARFRTQLFLSYHMHIYHYISSYLMHISCISHAYLIISHAYLIISHAYLMHSKRNSSCGWDESGGFCLVICPDLTVYHFKYPSRAVGPLNKA